VGSCSDFYRGRELIIGHPIADSDVQVFGYAAVRTSWKKDVKRSWAIGFLAGRKERWAKREAMSLG
jgi:hypothetical protein